MAEFPINFRVRDSVCEAATGEHQYGIIFVASEVHRVETWQVRLGQRALERTTDTDSMVNWADDLLANRDLDTSDYRLGQLAAAVSIVELCTKHNEPNLEVRRNVIITPTRGPDHIPAKDVPAHERHFLPHAGKLTPYVTDFVMADRGAHTFPAYFAVFNTELVTRAEQPDTPPYGPGH